MPKETKYHSLIPVLNKKCVTFRGPSWWLSDSIQVRSLSDDEVRLISENSPQGITSMVQEGGKVMVVSDLPSGPFSRVKQEHKDLLRAIALSAQTTLNIISDEGAVSFPFSVTFSKAFIRQVRDIQEYEIWGDSYSISNKKYKIKSDITQTEVKEIFNLISEAYSSNPGLRVTMSRFCSSLLKSTPEDKLIDMAIALESMVPSGVEIGFRFSYYLSLFISSENEERKNIRKVLKEVYNARSALVHGGIDRQKSINKSLNNWNELELYAKRAIFYRVFFERQNRINSWDEHLIDLAYGENPII